MSEFFFLSQGLRHLQYHLRHFTSVPPFAASSSGTLMTAVLSLSTFNPYSVCAAPQHPPIQTWAALALLLLPEQLTGIQCLVHSPGKGREPGTIPWAWSGTDRGTSIHPEKLP